MSEKDTDKINTYRNSYIYGDESKNIKGCLSNGIKQEVAEKIFDRISEFASYAFNKSHAAAYAVLVSYFSKRICQA